jgi:hypothetical protein
VAGFAAARLGAGAEVTMHTGFWGCGAFGGNRVLMTALQVVAARLAEVARLVYWTGANPSDELAFSQGCDRADRLLDGARSATAIVERAAAGGYRWGVSDGS